VTDDRGPSPLKALWLRWDAARRLKDEKNCAPEETQMADEPPKVPVPAWLTAHLADVPPQRELETLRARVRELEAKNNSLTARLTAAYDRIASQSDALTRRAETPSPGDGPAEPEIVCLCGSTRFKQAFIEANFRETMAGNIVLTVGWFSHADGHVYALTQEEKAKLDELHLRKIDLCHRVFVVNVGGYVGDSTRREIAYALASGKRVDYLTPPPGEDPCVPPPSASAP
jgi:hypothetical protein